MQKKFGLQNDSWWCRRCNPYLKQHPGALCSIRVKKKCLKWKSSGVWPTFLNYLVKKNCISIVKPKSQPYQPPLKENCNFNNFIFHNDLVNLKVVGTKRQPPLRLRMHLTKLLHFEFNFKYNCKFFPNIYLIQTVTLSLIVV